MQAIDKTRNTWQQESGPSSWNGYEGDLDALRAGGEYTQEPGSNPLAAHRCGLVTTMVDDPVSPP